MSIASRASRAARTPLMEQYLRVKQEHPDAFLFFRLGDFYEMFFDDAVRGAALLGLTLTSRNKQDPEPIPMCGIPWHQRDAYVARLLAQGHKVAICDQLEDATQARGLVERGVTEVLTPGSVTGEPFLDPSAHNFLAALWPAPDRIGLCLADASTGHLQLAEFRWEDAGEVLDRLRVSEWLLPNASDVDDVTLARLTALLAAAPGARSVRSAAGAPDRAKTARRLGAALEPAADLVVALDATGAAFEYLDRMQGRAALQLTRLSRWIAEDTLRYDAATARHLELFQPQPGGENAHTLWHHLNLTVTAGGGRVLRGWIEQPLVRRDALGRRHDAVEGWLTSSAARAALRAALRGLPDLDRLAARIACARATPRDLGALRDALQQVPLVIAALEPLLESWAAPRRAALELDPALYARLAAALTDDPPPAAREGGVIRSGFDSHRDQLHELAHSGKRWIAELEAAERVRSGIPSLKVGYNRVFGYYLEITRTHLDKVPADYERRQTLTTAERFVTPALKVREQEVLSAEDRLRASEFELFTRLREELEPAVPALQGAAQALAELDAEATLAEVAARYRWVRPTLEDSDRLELEGARHPVVERLLPSGEFVPNSVELDGARRQILLLTGPNMGGKSTYLRQIALAVLLAQCGSFVPAKRAVIGIVDRLFTRVGAGDRLGRGQSTFMVEMSETADILRSATARSLVLLDEVGRGTSTYDGLALAWAVTEFLHASNGPRPRTLFATHYHELTQLAQTLPRLANVQVAVQERNEQVVFLHRIIEGAADRSYGIHVAQLAGLPASVITRAREVLGELESERTAEHLGAASRSDARSRPAETPQLGLFAEAPHPVVDELRGLAPDSLTPLAALQLLDAWKKRWGMRS